MKFLDSIEQLCAVIFYFTVGPCLIFLNNYLMNNADFHYPAFLSGLGVGFSAVISFLLIKVFGVVKQEHNDITLKFYMTKIMPIGFCLAMTLVSGNRAYLFISVSFIQMLKASTPLFILTILFILKLDKPSIMLICSMIMISTGTAAASFDEIKFSWTGFFLMFLSENCDALRLVLAQVMLSNLKFSPVEGLLFMAPAASFWQFSVALLTEDVHGALIKVSHQPILFIATGCLGFLVNLAGFWVIKSTSALTCKVLAIFRNMAVVVVSGVVTADVVQLPQYAAYCWSLVGMCIYQFARRNPQITDETIIKYVKKNCIVGGDTMSEKHDGALDDALEGELDRLVDQDEC